MYFDETIAEVPVRINIYRRGERIGDFVHSFMSPGSDSWQWFILAEVYPLTPEGQFDDTRFWSSELAIFEGVMWHGWTADESNGELLMAVRSLAANTVPGYLAEAKKRGY
ncbi:hypothetical protein Rctr85_036 [Virus Rctr85]|nr:hypothetical protein Rctr85_036 [Virus Rctr85]